MKCPRCGGSLDGERFYGPCSGCCAELRATVRPPKPDHKNYAAGTLPNGLPTTSYVGPRVDRGAK